MKENTMNPGTVHLFIFTLALMVGGSLPGQATLPAKTTVQQENHSESTITVDLYPVEIRREKIEVEIKIHNSGNCAVYVTSRPQWSNGSKGVYFQANDARKVLELSTHLYSTSGSIIIELDQTGAELQKLNPGESCSERFTLQFPLYEKLLPYLVLSLPKKIDLEQIKFIQAAVGVIPFDTGIEEILNESASRICVTGNTTLKKGPFKGKNLIDLQKVIHSDLNPVSAFFQSAYPNTTK
ncbi:MAG TPA: hypothetical protein PLB32_06005 [Acidobacteriota bacterium]|nr:hypothetical protein [Acidobacteriota bacterium]